MVLGPSIGGNKSVVYSKDAYILLNTIVTCPDLSHTCLYCSILMVLALKLLLFIEIFL